MLNYFSPMKHHHLIPVENHSKKVGKDQELIQGIGTNNNHNWPKIPMGKWQRHN